MPDAAALLLAALLSSPTPPAPPSLVAARAEQEGGAWVARLTVASAAPPTSAAVAGHLSNSAVEGHARPSWAALSAPLAAGAQTEAGVGSCRMAEGCRATLGASLGPSPGLGMHEVILRVGHDHAVVGAWDPLLGRPGAAVLVGGWRLDCGPLPLDRGRAAYPPDGWPEVPAEHRDGAALHLIGDEPGFSYYRFPERPVRHGARYRLRFRYLVARGTEGEARCRVAQYREAAESWRVLADGGRDDLLPVVGRWAAVDRRFRAEPGATTLALDFRLTPSDAAGEVWVDGVSLEAVDAPPEHP